MVERFLGAAGSCVLSCPTDRWYWAGLKGKKIGCDTVSHSMDRACLYWASYKVGRFVLGIRLGFGLSLGQDNPDPAKAGHRERLGNQ